MSYKGILLDLDDTLYNYNSAHEKGLSAAVNYASEILNKSITEIESGLIKAKKAVKIELREYAASHNRMLYFQLMYESFNVNAQYHTLSTYELYWDAFLQGMEFYKGAIEFLEFTNDLSVCLVTDLTAHIQHRKIKQLGIQSYIDFMVTSEEAGKEKPHPYIFMKALNKIGLNPDEVIMIGDNYSKDIVGASLLGIKTFWLNHSQKQLPKFDKNVTSVDDLLQVKEILNYAYQG